MESTPKKSSDGYMSPSDEENSEWTSGYEEDDYLNL